MRYRRARIAGGTYFFTVNLSDRRARLLVEHIDALHVDYIHFNPVRHGYAAKPADWPHSSIHRYVSRGLLPSDWAGGGAETFECGERAP
ncbi:MAG: hypothetical protein HY323_09920 [Betaproteobacteria bacterium]|nr:hypothetical protein [Betaproteobacteria bacterium]MBI3937283.1 hypothetical protein [Betaproteobacteria bacterium]